jgi:hypothetical protein
MDVDTVIPHFVDSEDKLICLFDNFDFARRNSQTTA